MLFNNQKFIIISSLPADVLSGVEMFSVESLSWNLFTGFYGDQDWVIEDGRVSLQREGLSDPSEWTAVAYRLDDGDEKTLVARKSDLDSTKSAWLAKEATPLTHNPFVSALGGL